MAGNSPGEAVEAFLSPLKLAISVLGDAVLVTRSHPPLGAIQVVTLNSSAPWKVESDHPNYESLHLELTLNFVVVEAVGELGPYKTSSRGYIMSLGDASKRELVSFHWHPLADVTSEHRPHFHVGEAFVPTAARMHVPTPRISVEEFITLAIDSFGAHPVVDEDIWRPLLADGRETYERYRQWGTHGDTPEFND